MRSIVEYVNILMDNDTYFIWSSLFILSGCVVLIVDTLMMASSYLMDFVSVFNTLTLHDFKTLDKIISDSDNDKKKCDVFLLCFNLLIILIPSTSNIIIVYSI